MKFKGSPAEANERVQVELFKLMDKGVDWVEIETKTRRNAKFHSKFFVFCNFIADFLDEDRESVRSIITIKAGHRIATVLNTPDGEYVHYQAKTINFASMSEEEFQEFYEKAVNSAFLIWDIDNETQDKLKDF